MLVRDNNWYAINTKPNQEQRVSLNLQSGGIETFTPKIKAFRTNDFTKKRIVYKKNLFPGYIFAKFNLSKDFNKVKYTRGLQRIVSLGGNPCIVDDDIIAIIQNNADKDDTINFDVKFNPGDKVVIKKPYLEDLVGIFVKEVSENKRVKILLSTVNYQLFITTEKDNVYHV